MKNIKQNLSTLKVNHKVNLSPKSEQKKNSHPQSKKKNKFQHLSCLNVNKNKKFKKKKKQFPPPKETKIYAKKLFHLEANKNIYVFCVFEK